MTHNWSETKQGSGSTKRSVLKCIKDNQPINRSAISKIVGISIPAVMTITDDLIKQGFVCSIGRTTSGVGKHPELLSIRGDAYSYVGVDIGRVHIRAVVTGQDSKIISSKSILNIHGEDPEACFADIKKIVDIVIKESKVAASSIVGICIAMPGLIESNTGRVIFSPNFGWHDVPMQERMNEILAPYQVIVHNANNAQALWETEVGKETGNMVCCVGLGYGIGCGLILDGEIYDGVSGTSGEIGHITVSPNGPVCTCGNKGCLESISSGRAIGLSGQKAAAKNKDGQIFKLSGGNLSSIDAEIVFKAAKSGDKDAIKILDNAAKYIGIALSAIINMFDPDIIYLCGGLIKNENSFFDKIKLYTKNRTMKFAGSRVKILKGSFDEYNVAKGATEIIHIYGDKFEKLKSLY